MPYERGGAEPEPIRVESDQESEVDFGRAEQFGSLFGLRKHAVLAEALRAPLL